MPSVAATDVFFNLWSGAASHEQPNNTDQSPEICSDSQLLACAAAALILNVEREIKTAVTDELIPFASSLPTLHQMIAAAKSSNKRLNPNIQRDSVTAIQDAGVPVLYKSRLQSTEGNTVWVDWTVAGQHNDLEHGQQQQEQCGRYSQPVILDSPAGLLVQVGSIEDMGEQKLRVVFQMQEEVQEVLLIDRTVFDR